MNWLRAVERLRLERRPGVLVTITETRGHAPRAAGAKMVVTEDATWDTIGGGNLEATAVARARRLLAGAGPAGADRGAGAGPAGADRGAGPGAAHADQVAVPGPETHTISLTDKAPVEYGQQCCGGEVTLLLEPLPVVPAVAIFGLGHVGIELARILARHDLELHLVDSREDQVQPSRFDCLDDAVARVHLHHAPVPELVLGEVPAGTHVLIMTHDHAEDAALCDVALRSTRLGSIGLIGSAAKWRRFERRLAAEGHDRTALARITTPIGLPDMAGKDPATIAVSVAAALLQLFHREPAHHGAGTTARSTAGPPSPPASARPARPPRTDRASHRRAGTVEPAP